MSNVWRGRREKLKQDMRKLLKGLNSFMSCMWEWFHKCVRACVCVCVQQHVQLFATPWTILWNSPGQNTGVDSLSLFQGIFPTQGLNPGLPHCRWILYQLSRQGGPDSREWALFPQPASKHHLGKITTLYFSGIHHSAKQSSGHMEGLQ